MKFFEKEHFLLIALETIVLVTVIGMCVCSRLFNVNRIYVEQTNADIEDIASVNDNTGNDWINEYVEGNTDKVSLPESEVEQSNETPLSENEGVQEIMDKLATMSVEEKLYQMIATRPETMMKLRRCTVVGETSIKNFNEKPVGGLIYSTSNYEDKNQFEKLLNDTDAAYMQRIGLLPVYFAMESDGSQIAVADFSEGRIANVTAAASKRNWDSIPEGLKIIDSSYNLNDISIEVVQPNENMEVLTAEVVEAINSGVDMLYTSDRFDEVYHVLDNAITSGSLTEDRVNESVIRILKVKMAN